jgi:CDP-paratose 2-epimerase
MKEARKKVNGNGVERTALITGGAGFVGCNVAATLARAGWHVIVYDDLSRPGVERNLAWLKREHGDRIEAVIADVRSQERLRPAVERAERVFHFAAQVAVTHSLVSPLDDFGVNAAGTLNLLEAMRACQGPPSLVFTSTNKVYGALDDVALAETRTRYLPSGNRVRAGIDERRALDFHSPYGCSKGSADQYVIDYGRSFGLRTAVFRMSCIYGPHQFGTEDQGWVAHFLIRALRDQPITIYGDGKQVRDVLYVDDLVAALVAAHDNIDALKGRAFNIGGGAANSVSLVELLDLIEELQGAAPRVKFGPWRVGDQRYYVSDHASFTRATGWRPRVPVLDGVARLHRWLSANVVRGERMRYAATGARPAAARIRSTASADVR